ncbi:MAG: hypothetical protein SOX32_03080 [Candidatus Choladocola sp.]|nr:hypothetical protein [Candidatus Choladocola sp.]
MRLEDLKQEFPEMPVEMKTRMEQKVAEQMQKKPKRNRNPRRAVILALAAALALGTTVLAGTKLYQFYVERVGNYGAKTVARPGETEAQDTEKEEAVTESAFSENPGLAFTWLPEGMVAADEDLLFTRTADGILEGMGGKLQFFYEDAPWVGGISLMPYLLDTEQEFEVFDKNIMEQETLEVNGHQCVYLKRLEWENSSVDFDKILYVFYPEGNLVLQIYAAENVSREDVLKFVEGIRLTEYEKKNQDQISDPISWSDYLKMMLEEPEENVASRKTEVSVQEMENLHTVGENFCLLNTWAEDKDGNTFFTSSVEATVTEVQTADDLSMLNPAYINEMLQNQTDENGRLKPAEIRFVRYGDGVSSVDEVLKTEKVQQKLVYVTVEYKNTGDVPLYNVLFFANLLKLQKTEEGYAVFDRAAKNPECDGLICTGRTDCPEMIYYDVQGGDSNGSNYFDCIRPGETATVHLGFLAGEDELDKLYLDLCPSGAGYEFCRDSLAIGYTDIRQQ